jgi:hypothetical protein
MNDEEMAASVKDAMSQVLVLPERLQDWRHFACLINGYAIAKELGQDPQEFTRNTRAIVESIECCDQLDLLDLRLMLFFECRIDHFSGWTNHERDEAADRLLRAIARKLNLPDPADNSRWYSER